MNLGKLFNFKYLKQNVKKSKGLITVLIFIIPVITALMLIGNNTSNYVSSTEQVLVSLPNLLGMYAIPFIISYILYGYVYKKNSVDFVGSMPVTRTTIFVTNYVGGIILIAIIQILTAIATSMCAMFLSNIFIAPQMILDIFIVMLIAYIFVFSATTVAMTVSGNVLTQIVVTLLVLFLIPFTITFGFSGVSKDINIELDNRQVTINNYSVNEYTMPSIFFTELFGESTSFYSVNRNVKTLVISSIYFVIGLYLFNKRKMENVEISFSKIWVHLIVKGITLVPMVFVLELLDLDNIFKGIAITLIFIYYCLYDFITNRKVSVKLTIPCFISSFAILVGLYHGMVFLGEKIYQTSFSVNDIQAITVENGDSSYYSSVSSMFYKSNNLNSNYITDKGMIKKVCEALVDMNNSTYEDYSYTAYTPVIHLKFKLNNNKELVSISSINYAVYQELNDYFESNEGYLNRYKEEHKLGPDSYIIANEKFLTKEDTDILINMYNNFEAERLIQADREFIYTGGYQRNYIPQPGFTVFFYKNHELCRFELNPFLSQELFNKMTEISVERLNEVFEAVDSGKEKYIDAYIAERRVSTYAVQDSGRNYGSFKNTAGLINYAREHMNEKIDMNDCFYVVSINSTYPLQSTIYLKETEELNYIIERDTYKDSDYEITYDYSNDAVVEY